MTLTTTWPATVTARSGCSCPRTIRASPAGRWPPSTPAICYSNCRKILTEIFANLDGRGDPAAASRLGEHLLKAAFLGDGDLGRRVLQMLIEDGRLEEPLWREAVLKVAAGLLARSPALLRATLKDAQVDGAIEREARGYLSKDVLYHRDTFSGQVGWDRAMVNMLTYNPRFRYLLIQDLMGGFARAQDTADIGVAVRRAIVNTTVVTFGNEPDECYAQLAVDEVLGSHALRSNAPALPWGVGLGCYAKTVSFQTRFEFGGR